MVVSILNPAAQAMVHRLSETFCLGIEPGKAMLKRSDLPLGDITALVEIASTTFHASLAITFNEQSILMLTQKLLHETHLCIDDSVESVACEIAAMIGCDVKRKFADKGQAIVVKHPSVFVGFGERIVHPTDGPKVVFPINTEEGIIFLEICVETAELCENYPQAEAKVA